MAVVLTAALFVALVVTGIVVNAPTHNNVTMATSVDDITPPLLQQQAAAPKLKSVPISTNPRDSNTLIIGAGVGGLVSGYRLAPILKDKLVIVDERDHVGGKVHSIRKVSSNNTHPTWGPTHAEQFRGGDSISRCIAQEVGSILVKRLTMGAKLELAVDGRNISGFQCYGPGNIVPNVSASCAVGSPYDMFAPNYDGFDPSVYPGLPPNLCGRKDWTECSYLGELQKLIISSAGKIISGESAEQFITRVFGAGTTKFINNNFEFYENWDARAMIDYWSFDFAFPYGALSMPHGGPQVDVWDRVARLIQKNGSRIYLGNRITSINYATGTDASDGYKYVATLADNTKFRTTRLVLAFPTGHFDSMTGTVVDDLKASKFIQYNGAGGYCSYNAYYETKWWETGKVCNAGVCATAKAFNISGFGDNGFLGHQIIHNDAMNQLWGQYIATPERREGNFYRFFGTDDSECAVYNTLFGSGGVTAVQQEVERRLSVLYANAVPPVVVSPVVEHYYAYEPLSVHIIRPGAPFTVAQQIAWATNPLPGQRIVFATENLNQLHTGWQEGAAISAHNALAGPVFKDTISATQVRALERCRANVTNGANRYLDNSNKNSGNDICLLLRNEYTIRELSGTNVCGGPTEYQWPPLSSFTGTPFDPNQNMWSGATSTPVYDASLGYGKRRALLA